jgi:acetyltransferase-like isoleucine patch superfamily enzyme
VHPVIGTRDGSVVAAGSVVTRSIVAGFSAIVTRREIAWERWS